jgi:2-polyprenyl-3-methyl-5-hydroxy-6-metoxy-1,4-benzoquinol methylase
MQYVEQCPVCHGREMTPFAMASGKGLLHHAQVECRGCGLLISQPQATVEEMRHFYQRTYYDELWPDPIAYDTMRLYRNDELDLMRRLWGDTPPPPGAEVIEIGCGWGEMLVLLREQGYRPRGAEIGARAIEHCRRQGFEIDDAFWPALPYPKGRADLSISLQVVEHVTDPRAFVRDSAELVRPGGLVVIATEDAWTSQTAWERLYRQLKGRIPEFRSPTDHTFVFQGRHLARLLEEAGCDARTASYTRRPPPERLHWRLYKSLFRAADRLLGHGDFLMAVGRRR